ncbi:MAG TPA: hypothetical protein VJ813_17780 [Vicinamibacterales bacterium]|nr:hypothetical protein [Vicinamibacterales bacterium]
MTQDTARTVANVVVAAAAVGAAVVIVRTPALRRLAYGLARTAITVGVPAWLSREVRQAWDESGAARGAEVQPRHARGVIASGA